MPSSKNLATIAFVGSVAIVAHSQQCTAFSPVTMAPASRISSTHLSAKGRRSKDLVGIGGGGSKAGGNSGKGVTGLGGEATPAAQARSSNWVPVAGMDSLADLPQEENKVSDILLMDLCVT